MRRRREVGRSRKEVPHYEFGVLDNVTKEKISVLPGIKSVLENLKLDGGMVKVYQVWFGRNYSCHLILLAFLTLAI